LARLSGGWSEPERQRGDESSLALGLGRHPCPPRRTALSDRPVPTAEPFAGPRVTPRGPTAFTTGETSGPGRGLNQGATRTRVTPGRRGAAGGRCPFLRRRCNDAYREQVGAGGGGVPGRGRDGGGPAAGRRPGRPRRIRRWHVRR